MQIFHDQPTGTAAGGTTTVCMYMMGGRFVPPWGEVFVYRDSEDRLIATVHTPQLTLHSVARVRVAQVAKVGAFLDWGLEKDLLLPYK